MTADPDPSAATPVPTLLDDPAAWGPERSKSVAWHDPGPTATAGRTMSGLDYLRAMAAGRLPGPPIAGLFGMTLDEVQEGRVVFRCVPDDSTYNPLGTVHGGLMCTILDSAAGCAVHSTLPAGVGYTSAEIKVNYMRAVRAGVPLLATGRVTKPGRRLAFAEAEIRDPDDRLVANATSSLLILQP